MGAAALAVLAHFGRVLLGVLVIVAAVLSLFGCVAGVAAYAAYLMEPEAARKGLEQALALPHMRALITAAIVCVGLSLAWLCWMVGDDTASTLSRACRTSGGDHRGLLQRLALGFVRFIWTSIMGAVSVAMSAVGIAGLVCAVAAIGLMAVAPSIWASLAGWAAAAGVTTGDVVFGVSAAALCAAWFLWSVGMDVTDR